MALFQKKPQTSSSAPLYTLGLEKTVLIAGLGNPGKQFDGTRHNVGFACLDFFANHHDFPTWIEQRTLKCILSSHRLGDSRVLLIKPTTYMNLSGEALQAVQHFYKVPTDKVLVVHDELDIPFGQIRTRVGGSSAGHNGIESLINLIGKDFARIRVGIGQKSADEISQQTDSADFVLSKFTAEQQEYLPPLYKEVASIIGEFTATATLTADTRSFMV